MAKIYAIRCKITGISYVGCTKGKLAKRMREHRCLLNQEAHKVLRLQSDWMLYGPEAFEMVELEDLPLNVGLEGKREAELRWQHRLEETGLLYNEHKVSFSPTQEAIRKGQPLCAEAARGRVSTPEANLKRRLAQLGKPKGHGAKISATKRAKRLQVMR